jgi:hypothetical protein
MAINIINLDQTYDIVEAYVVVEKAGAPALLRVNLETVSNNAKNYANATAESLADASGLTAEDVEAGDPPLYTYTIDETTNYLAADDFVDYGLESNLKNALFILDDKIKEAFDTIEDIEFSTEANAKIIGDTEIGVSSVIDYIEVADTETESTKITGTGHATITIKDLIDTDTDIGVETATIQFRNGNVAVVSESTADIFSVTDTASRFCLLWTGSELELKNNLGYDAIAIISATMYNELLIS